MVTLGPRTAIWLAVALVVSLGVNLFVAGVFAGRFVSDGAGVSSGASDRPAAGRRGGLPPVIRRMAQSLPEEHRKIFLGTIRSHRATIAAAARELRAGRKDMRREVSRDPFDRQAFAAVLEEQRRRNVAVQKAMHEAIMEALSKIPADARRGLANMNQRRPSR